MTLRLSGLCGLTFALFATARSVGLLAHSMEQLSVAQVIRPRGRYVGVVPDVPTRAPVRPKAAQAGA